MKVRESHEVHAPGIGANERLGREVAYLVNQLVLDGTGHTLIQAGELESRLQLLQQTLGVAQRRLPRIVARGPRVRIVLAAR